MATARSTSGLEKRSMVLYSERTSVALEEEFWDALEEVVRVKRTTLPKVVEEIGQTKRKNRPMASAIRVYVLEHFRTT